MTNRTGRGRPNAPAYVTSWGETIDGAYKGKDNKLRPIGLSKPTFTLTDEAKAVHRFKRWKSEQPGFKDPKERQFQRVIERDNKKDLWRSYFRTLILTDPQRASIELDVPHLAEYPVRREVPQFTLRQLGEHYLESVRNKQGQPLAKKHVENSRRMWNEFCDSVDVTYPRQLTKDALNSCAATVSKKTYKDGTKVVAYSAASIRNRLVKVKAVLNWGIKKTNDSDDLRTVLNLCNQVFDLPQVESNPDPIEPKHFLAALAIADTQTKAMLLLGLNAAMHSGEITQVLKADVNLKERTLTARRPKTRHVRVAYLWERTVKAIAACQNERPHNGSESLFVSNHGSSMSGETLRQRFIAIRKRAKLPKTVTLEGLRNAAYTVAESVDSHHAKFIAGHKTGMSDKYVLRQATNQRVKECCEAIERHFFAKDE